MYKFAESVLLKEQIDYFIFGHRHRMTNEKIGQNSRFILLGDWITSFSYGVFDGETVDLKRYKEQQ